MNDLHAIIDKLLTVQERLYPLNQLWFIDIVSSCKVISHKKIFPDKALSIHEKQKNNKIIYTKLWT